MYQEISKLLMYGDLSQDEILYKLGQLFEQFEVGEYNKTELAPTFSQVMENGFSLIIRKKVR